MVEVLSPARDFRVDPGPSHRVHSPPEVAQRAEGLRSAVSCLGYASAHRGYGRKAPSPGRQVSLARWGGESRSATGVMVQGFDAKDLLERDWRPGRIGPANPLWRFWCAVQARRDPEAAWEFVASIAIPAASLSIAIYALWAKGDSALLLTAVVALAGIGAYGRYRLFLDKHGALGQGARERTAVGALLRKIVQECFRGTDHCRATWFRPDRRRKVLIPFARYYPGTLSIKPDSKAMYPYGVSYTGAAWKKPGFGIIYRHKDMPFPDRPAMEAHYMDRKFIGIHKYIVKRVGDTMIPATCILAIGIEDPDPKGKFLGVLSIDFFGRGGPLGADDVKDINGLEERVLDLRDLEIAHLRAR